MNQDPVCAHHEIVGYAHGQQMLVSVDQPVDKALRRQIHIPCGEIVYQTMQLIIQRKETLDKRN